MARGLTSAPSAQRWPSVACAVASLHKVPGTGQVQQHVAERELCCGNDPRWTLVPPKGSEVAIKYFKLVVLFIAVKTQNTVLS